MSRLNPELSMRPLRSRRTRKRCCKPNNLRSLARSIPVGFRTFHPTEQETVLTRSHFSSPAWSLTALAERIRTVLVSPLTETEAVQITFRSTVPITMTFRWAAPSIFLRLGKADRASGTDMTRHSFLSDTREHAIQESS